MIRCLLPGAIVSCVFYLLLQIDMRKCFRTLRQRLFPSSAPQLRRQSSPPSDFVLPIACKRYATGPMRTRTAEMRNTEQSGYQASIFASQARTDASMQEWDTLVVSPAIDADGELADAEEFDVATPSAQMLGHRADAAFRDEEIHAMLEELDAGEGFCTGDITDQERQAIDNFDIRAYA